MFELPKQNYITYYSIPKKLNWFTFDYRFIYKTPNNIHTSIHTKLLLHTS